MHAVLTSVIALGVMALYALGWYPSPFLTAAGGARLLAVHLTVLFATGPLLTLLLYRPGKRGLRTDVWMIVILQSAALIGGLYASYLVRPAYVAILPLRATLVRANQVVNEPRSGPKSLLPSHWGPRTVAVDDPPTEQERSEILLAVIQGQPDIDYRPAFYRPIDERIDSLLVHATPLIERMQDAPQIDSVYTAWLRKHGYSSPQTLFVYPMAGTTREVEIVLDASKRRVVGYIALP